MNACTRIRMQKFESCEGKYQYHSRKRFAIWELCGIREKHDKGDNERRLSADCDDVRDEISSWHEMQRQPAVAGMQCVLAE